MELKEKISRICLVSLVSLSLILSYFIWMSPIQSPKKEENLQPKISRQPTAIKANTEVFLPSQMVWHQKSGKKVSTRESVINAVLQQLQKSTIDELTLSDVGQGNKYQEILFTKNAVELDYVGNFLLNEFAHVYKVPFKGLDHSIRFNRILVDFEKKKIFVMNDTEKLVYEGSIKGDEKDFINELEKNDYYVDASIGNGLLPYYYYTDKPLFLPMYSYIVSTQPYTTFTRAFFEDANDFTISNANGDTLLYDTPHNETLEISNKTGKVYFKTRRKIQPTEERQNPDEMNLFQGSYNYISRLGVQLGNIRYFDEERSVLNFTTYIEGYPLFSTDNRGQVHFRFNQEENLEISTNVQTIQIPIPSDEKVVLKSTLEVLNQLSSHNLDVTKIDDVQIGYQWQNVEETSQVVNLIPQWFIHYENKWWSESELLNKVQEEGGQ